MGNYTILNVALLAAGIVAAFSGTPFAARKRWGVVWVGWGLSLLFILASCAREFPWFLPDSGSVRGSLTFLGCALLWFLAIFSSIVLRDWWKNARKRHHVSQ